jgi:hypothetical protein
VVSPFPFPPLRTISLCLARPKWDMLQDNRSHDAPWRASMYSRARVSECRVFSLTTEVWYLPWPHPAVQSSLYSAKGLTESAQRLEKATGSQCLAASADVRDAAQVDKAVEECISKFGRIDYIICGAAGNLCVATLSPQLLSSDMILLLTLIAWRLSLDSHNGLSAPSLRSIF